MLDKYETADEYLSYSQLKDRIREECGKNLPTKERIVLMAKKLEEDLTPKDSICCQICTDLGDVTSERHIRRCLPGEYKQQKKKRVAVESTDDLRTSMSCPLYPPTVEFERFLIESRESIMAVAGHFNMILTGLIIQTGSIEAARSLIFSTIIAEYLNLSESEFSKRLRELVQYANALLQIGQHMEFLRDWK
jgi:hypothetical protein